MPFLIGIVNLFVQVCANCVKFENDVSMCPRVWKTQRNWNKNVGKHMLGALWGLDM